MKKFNKVISALILIITLLMQFSSVFAAFEVQNAFIQYDTDCGDHLQVNNGGDNWGKIITSYVEYQAPNGQKYPAYCLDKTKPGVGNTQLGDTPDGYNVNVEKLLDNNLVYTAVINGYPYKTPEELGLQDKYDAFAATKLAIYSVIYGTDVNAKYRGIDSRGQNIIRAINSIVNKARTETKTQSTALISFTKVGEFGEDSNKNYYSQTYKVNSDIDMKQYTITATGGLPSGSFIADTSGGNKTTFSAGENFKIMIPKAEANKIENVGGVISVQAKCKNYPVFYASKDASWQPYALTFDPYGDNSGELRVNYAMNTGKIKITKTDAETSGPIEGVTFQLQKADGTVVANSTTGSDGIATFSKLLPGNYKLKELSTNKNYILNESTFDVTVEYNGTATKTITNEHKRGDLKVYKVDKDNHKVALGNVEFQLYSEEFKRVIGTYKTDVNGEIKIENIRTGEYKLIEKTTNKWYNLAKDTNVKVEWNTVTNSVVENELKKGQIKVIKIDKDNNEVKLEGVEFEVLDENDKVLEKIITNENGEALTSRYPIRDFSKLKLRESKTLENYVLSDEVQTITLKENQIENITFQNEKKKGQLKVIKVDLDNNEIRIPNVEFEVYDETGKVVDTLITDKNGEAVSKKLPIDQEYRVKETKTDTWYVLNTNEQKITLEYNKIKDMTFMNEKKKGQLKVIKIDKDNHEILLEGVTFDILDENGNVVDTIKTDKNGVAVSKRLPIDQKYTAFERETLKEYVLTEETQTVTLKQDEVTPITVENEKIKGYVEITKVDSETRETLKDAKFGIYNEKNELVGTLTTDENGKAKSELIPYGKYYLKELDTGSVYYLLNENTYEFEITKNHETVPLTIENDGVDIEVTVDKEGTSEIKPGENVDYTFSNVGNASNVFLENFKWFDYIPTDYIRLEKMTTGTWNQDLTYSVYYKTNKSDDYILFKENLSTQENYDLDFTTIQLAEDEYITETMYDFGKVDVGFKESISPTMQCKSFDTLKDGETFTNYTKTVGVYYGITADSDSKWTTVVHVPEEKHEPVLPRTGE